MSKGVNKVILVGNLGNEPEVRQTQSGSVANISVATSDVWKDKASGEMKERTEWHKVTLFGKLSEIVGQYLHKGSKVYIEGSLRTEKYTDKQGIERYTTKIIASEMQMLDSKAMSQQSQPNSAQSPASTSSEPYKPYGATHAVMPPPVDSAPMSDDDIPF